jgi:hypothetical protein
MTYLGDPATMRSEAARAELRADQMAELMNRVATRAQALTFEGPAAYVFRLTVIVWGVRVLRSATALLDAAALLRNAAAHADEELARRARELAGS